MKHCPDNQVNVFYCGRLSSAQLHVVPLQAPKHRPIIGPHPVEQTAFRRDIKKTMDINPSLQICGCNVNGTGRG